MNNDDQVVTPADPPKGPPRKKASTVVDPGWAWSAYKPGTDRPWTMPLAGHLYRRAAFGANLTQLEDAVSLGPERTIERLIRPDADVAQFDRQYDRDEDAISRSGGIEGPRAWWLRRMVATPHPLQENMTLFWHSHFGVANQRVKSPVLMIQHIRMLREHALGDYTPMLEAATRDPAVLLGLDASVSRRSMPNESLSRQLMDRLSVGPGKYGEEDVREAARAFTGWFVLRGKLRYFSHEHDPGTKNVLGQKGEWNAEDIVRLVLASPATSEMLVRKLYRWLISEIDDPSNELLQPLATMLAKDYNIGRVVETMLRSNLFFSPAAYRKRVKSPIDLALGVIRGMGGMVPTQQLGADLAVLGQDLYNPPTVSGWLGGSHWISSTTMIGRANLADALLAPKGAYGGKLDPTGVVPKHDQGDQRQAGGALLDLFLQGDVADATRRDLLASTPSSDHAVSAEWMREFAYRVLTLPEFQLC